MGRMEDGFPCILVFVSYIKMKMKSRVCECEYR